MIYQLKNHEANDTLLLVFCASECRLFFFPRGDITGNHRTFNAQIKQYRIRILHEINEIINIFFLKLNQIQPSCATSHHFLDEGMFVMKGVFPGVEDPVAYVGVVEKGWANVEVSVEGVQGHSSTPPKETAVGILANAIVNLEDDRQPSNFGESVEYDTMGYVAPFASFGYKLVLGNLWLFKSLVSMILSNDAATDAIQRTTTGV